jgi:hypothetical protein
MCCDTVLLSLPRSGNSWVRYCIEFLTKKPTIAENRTNLNRPIGELINIGVNLSAKPTVYKKHQINEEDKDKKVILILRNYKECMGRQAKVKGSFGFGRGKEVIDRYMANAVYYNNLNKKKMFFFYEDFIVNPNPILTSILTFLGENTTYLKSFISNFQQHKNKSLSLYTKFQQYSFTRGNKKIHHINQFDKSLLKQWDNYVSNKYQNIRPFWERYITGG